MPCSHCDKSFDKRPCESNLGSPEIYDDNMNTFIKILGLECPCKSCLVRMICNDKSNTCEKFTNLLREVERKWLLKV